MAKNSENQAKYRAQYNKQHYHAVTVRLAAGCGDVLQRYAAMHDRSVNAYIVRAIRQCMQDDGAPADDIRAVCGDDLSGGK